jgi:transcriptional regulator with XRE-family HTH domain
MHTGVTNATTIIPRCVVTGESAADKFGSVTKNERMIALRKARGWNQNTLARESGVGQPTISRIERGATETPDAPTQKALARALGTTTLELFGAAAIDAPLPPPAQSPAVRTVRDDPTTRLERIIARSNGELEDIDAARAAARQSALYLADDTDLGDLARWYLAAAKRLRTDGRDADPAAVVTLAMVMRSSTSARTIVEQSAEANAAGADELEALNNPKSS